jgi:hypothetical protein
MVLRRTFAVIGALALTAVVVTPSSAQEKRKLSRDETTQYEALHALVDAVMAGKPPAPSDVKLTFQNHFLKTGTSAYVPYTLEISGSTFSDFAAMYVRAVRKAPKAGVGVLTARAPKSSDFAFADVYFLSDQGPPQTGAISRALELPAGEYDVYVALRQRASKDRKAPPPRMAVHTQSLTVPDMNSGLTTSSIILAKSLEPAAAQLTAQEQLEQPFSISGYKITPAFTATIPKGGELLLVFFVYNEGVAASGKPDLDVDYNFFRAAEEKPFSKLATTPFNATTLPGEFNRYAGHQVFVGQEIPLTSFAPGDYKLEIRITDKINSQTLTRYVPFTVAP